MLIPDLSHLAFLPAELIHVQSGQASVFYAVTQRNGGTAVWFGLEKAELDTDIWWLQYSVPPINPMGLFSTTDMILILRAQDTHDPVITCIAENQDQRWIEEAGAWQTAVNLSCTRMVQTAPCWTTLSATSILPDSSDTFWVDLLTTPASCFFHKLVPLQQPWHFFLVKV